MNICRGWCLILYYSTSKVNNRMNSQTLADQETGRICVWRTHLWRRCSLCRRAAIRDDDGGENPRESEAVMARGIPAMGSRRMWEVVEGMSRRWPVGERTSVAQRLTLRYGGSDLSRRWTVPGVSARDGARGNTWIGFPSPSAWTSIQRSNLVRDQFPRGLPAPGKGQDPDGDMDCKSSLRVLVYLPPVEYTVNTLCAGWHALSS